MKLLVLFLAVAISFGLYVWESQRLPSGGLSVENFSEVSITPIEGKEFQLAEMSGDVLLHFWATWCAPCVTELPHLINFMETEPDMTLIAISVDVDARIIPSFLEKLDIAVTAHDNIIWAHDPQQKITNGVFNVYQFPETLLLNSEKQLTRRLIGAQNWAAVDLF